MKEQKTAASPPQPAPCGGPKDAVGAAFVAMGTNVVVGLISGIVSAAVASSRPGATREEIALAGRRGLVVGSATHGVIVGGLGLANAERHPYFSGAATYVGVASLATAALVAVLPDRAVVDAADASLSSPPSIPVGGIQTLPGDGPGPTVMPARGVMGGCPFMRALGLGSARVGGPGGVSLPRRTY